MYTIYNIFINLNYLSFIILPPNYHQTNHLKHQYYIFYLK